MPTYSYRCTHCNHAMDVFQKITDAPLSQCSACKKETLQRGIGGGQVHFQFKGKGFYQTDYKSNSKPASECCPCGKKSKTECSKS